MGSGELNAGANPSDGLEVLILLVASSYRNWIKSGLMGHLARLQIYQEMFKTIPLPWTTKTLPHVHVT